MIPLLPVALIQQSCSANRSDNLAKTTEMITNAAASGAKLAILQELHTSTYFCQVESPTLFDIAETIPGPTTEHLGRLARELKIVIVASIFERRAVGLYHNTAVVLENDGSIAGTYRKMHIPDDPGFYEKFYFTPGDTGFRPVKTSVGNLGVLVCWDQWYPEAARLMALAGAEILIYPTAIGWDPNDDTNEQQRQYDAWFTIQRGHAIANGLPVIAVNRVGFEKSQDAAASGIQFWGGSFVAGSQGEVVATASQDSEEVLFASIDGGACEKVRRIWPFLRDRRIDEYGDLTRRYLD